MAILEKIEFEKIGPCRFIGKSIYARAGSEYSGHLFGALWAMSGGIFEAIDGLKEYATAEMENAALLTWDKYDDQKQLMGYTVGRFMKADTPVPEGLDFIDIPDISVAKGWVKGEFDDMIQNAEGLTSEAIEQQDKYVPTWLFMAEIYTKDTVLEAGVNSVLGYYIACKEKES